MTKRTPLPFTHLYCVNYIISNEFSLNYSFCDLHKHNCSDTSPHLFTYTPVSTEIYDYSDINRTIKPPNNATQISELAPKIKEQLYPCLLQITFSTQQPWHTVSHRNSALVQSHTIYIYILKAPIQTTTPYGGYDVVCQPLHTGDPPAGEPLVS